MKQFRKRHDYFPSPDRIERILRRFGDQNHVRRYHAWLREENLIPRAIRAVTLARPSFHKRMEIEYFPDLRTFLSHDVPNRSLPARKFMDRFKGMVSQDEIERVVTAMTDFRMEIYTTQDGWLQVYDDDNVHSCMSECDIVRCYAHPENNLALAALYGPGSEQVIARTIINTAEKWYVRIFGDALIVNKLNELGYYKLNQTPKEFKMYGYCLSPYNRDSVKFPYFDFPGQSGGHLPKRVLPETFNPQTNLVEAIINEGRK